MTFIPHGRPFVARVKWASNCWSSLGAKWLQVGLLAFPGALQIDGRLALCFWGADVQIPFHMVRLTLLRGVVSVFSEWCIKLIEY